jgi:hypothetical protein
MTDPIAEFFQFSHRVVLLMSGFDDLLGNRSIGINNWTFNFLSCYVRGAQVPAKQPSKQA